MEEDRPNDLVSPGEGPELRPRGVTPNRIQGGQSASGTGPGSDGAETTSSTSPYRFLFAQASAGNADIETWARKALRISPFCLVELSGVFPDGGSVVTAEVLPPGDDSQLVECETCQLSASTMLVLLPNNRRAPEVLRLSLVVEGVRSQSIDVPFPLTVPPLTIPLVRQQLRELLDWSWNGSAIRRAWRSRTAAGASRREAMLAARAQVAQIRDLLLRQFLESEGEMSARARGLSTQIEELIDGATKDARTAIDSDLSQGGE